MIYQSIYQSIGNTPVVKLKKLSKKQKADIYLKLEWFNPGGSVKDRIAINMIEEAEKTGLLKPGDTIVEPTSGNTGIGIAMVGAAKGYKTILIMPDSLSLERRKILQGYGAELILNPAETGMKGSIKIAEDLVKEHGYFMPMQFKNINNPKAHMKATALEILADFPKLDYFIAGVGTGGTITGVGQILRQEKPEVSIKAVEPKGSAVLSGQEKGPHKIQGIGAGFIPDILDTTVYDEVLLVEDEAAFEMARKLSKEQGLFVGISTGANVAAALELAERVKEGDVILTVSPSNAERYLSTALFEQ
jgi:cysteine synthase A